MLKAESRGWTHHVLSTRGHYSTTLSTNSACGWAVGPIPTASQAAYCPSVSPSVHYHPLRTAEITFTFTFWAWNDPLRRHLWVILKRVFFFSSRPCRAARFCVSFIVTMGSNTFFWWSCTSYPLWRPPSSQRKAIKSNFCSLEFQDFWEYHRLKNEKVLVVFVEAAAWNFWQLAKKIYYYDSTHMCQVEYKESCL